MIRYISGIFMFFALLSCDKGEEQRVQILSVDSSFTVIKQTAPVLADSCVPSCWPRVFERETDSKPYRVFIVSLTIPGEIDWFSSHDFARRITDSLSYPLLMYLRTLAARELLPAGTSGDISKRLQYDVVDQLLSRRMDSVKDVGYLQVSQVIVDAKNRRGMYIIQQTGTGYVELLVQIRWVNGRWQFVREDRMSIS